MKGSALLLRLFLLFFLFLMFLTSLFAQPGGGGNVSDSIDKSADELMVGSSFLSDANHVPNQGNPGLLYAFQFPQIRFDYMDNFQAFEVSQARVNEQGGVESEFDLLTGESTPVKTVDHNKMISECYECPHHSMTPVLQMLIRFRTLARIALPTLRQATVAQGKTISL
jgi:hypothetical protein